MRLTHRMVIDGCCGLGDAVAIPIGRLETEIRALAKADARVEALCVQPGVGLVTAMTLVAEIGDVSRFATASKLCDSAGLTPTMRTSDTSCATASTSAASRGDEPLGQRRLPPARPLMTAVTRAAQLKKSVRTCL
ncbi:MAG TPA: transposase [Actinomycetota bacterium]|nr:transposase [Actinomycetota bacterium]